MIAPPRRSRPAPQGFTLIELLVVIAIIAILTAILLPVFASVREGSRQGVAISNMKDIQQKMAQFKLDNHRYPEVLFGYAYPGSTMKTGLTMAQADDQKNNTHTAAAYFPGLYPAYIKDVEVFTDPNNKVNTSDTGQFTGQTATNIVAPCSPAVDMVLSGNSASGCTPVATTGGGATPTPGSVVSTTRNFYLADAYDSSPLVTGTNTANGASVVRYQLARENTVTGGATADLDYNYQLRWQNPPAGTLVTATTYHVQNADKVLVLFESGAVKKVTGADFASLEGSGGSTFWRVNSRWPANIKP